MPRSALAILTLACFIFTAFSQTCPEPPSVLHSTLASACNYEPARSAIGCTMYRLCTNTSLNPPIFSSLCATWRIASSLCSDDANITTTISFCSQLRQSYTSDAQFQGCMQPYNFTSTAAVKANVLQDCIDMDLDPGQASPDMRGCDTCSPTSCPDPLVSYSQACADMPMGSYCVHQQHFCRYEANVSKTVGVGAAILCMSQFDAPRVLPNIVAPPRPPSPPPISQPPSPPSPPSACVADSAAASCASYVYPASNIAADLANLCKAMPYMPGCTVMFDCQAGRVTGDFCRNMTLLASICYDMPSMAGCRSYVPLCSNTSVVQQCKDYPAIPGLPTTAEARAAINAMCSSMEMTQCETCVGGACPDYLGPLADMCTEMPYMVGCDTYAQWCSASSAWHHGSSSVSYYCAGAVAYRGALGSDIPSMLMYFHQRTREVLLFQSWIPKTTGQGVGSFIAITGMTFAAVTLRTVHFIIGAAAAAGRMGPLGAPSRPAGPWWRPSGGQMALNALSAFLTLLISTLDLFGMLIAMTFNGAYFAAVVLGYVLGMLLLGHLKDNYLRHIGRSAVAASAADEETCRESGGTAAMRLSNNGTNNNGTNGKSNNSAAQVVGVVQG